LKWKPRGGGNTQSLQRDGGVETNSRATPHMEDVVLNIYAGEAQMRDNPAHRQSIVS